MVARRVYRYLRRKFNPLDPAKMLGRTFDLSKKERVDLEDFCIYVMPSDYIGASIKISKKYEPHVERAIRQHLQAGQNFLDVGGNIGYFTMLSASIVGPRGKVCVFEPNPQNLQLIYESIVGNSYQNVSVFPYAASDRADILRFTTVGSNGGVVTEYSGSQKHYLRVPAVRIDDVIPDIPIHMVKIDIEAHEPYAIRGMVRLIEKHRPNIITEYHPWAMSINNPEAPEAYLGQLEDLGYRIGVIRADDILHTDKLGVVAYWKGLNHETAHVDLWCEPR